MSTQESKQAMIGRKRHEDWKLNHPHTYWLVQRLNPCVPHRFGKTRGWFDNKFELDYMGSAEFEFGAPHDSLQRMREAGNFELREVNMTLESVTKPVYFVASSNGSHRDSFERKLQDFQAWLDKDLPSKGYTQFRERMTGEFGCMAPKYVTVIAWWSFDADIMWALERSVADKLLYGLEHPAQS